MTAILLFLSTIISGNGEIGKASIFSIYGDKYNPSNKPLACEQRIIKNRGIRYWNKILSYGVAHRTIPCGTKITIYSVYRKRIIYSHAYVVDRGPYGVLSNRKWVLRRKLRWGEKYRGVIDVLSPLAKRLKLNGMSYVLIKSPLEMKK